MIHLTRLNHIPLVVNSDLIEQIEMTPDTVITLTTGQKFMVLENADEVIRRIVEFRRSLLSGLPSQACDYAAQPVETRIPPA
jgi:flagellar protein FlbD